MAIEKLTIIMFRIGFFPLLSFLCRRCIKGRIESLYPSVTISLFTQALVCALSARDTYFLYNGALVIMDYPLGMIWYRDRH